MMVDSKSNKMDKEDHQTETPTLQITYSHMTLRYILPLAIIAFFSSCSESRYSDALSPEDALASFDVNKGFHIELFAAEPFVRDPVEMVFDEQGNAFVVQMPDYPFRPESGKGTGTIVMLSDTSGDGRIDKSIVFADSLLEATSILPWDGGLIVTAAPEIFFLKDTDGDHRADVKEVLFTGFFNKNAETQITNLRFSVDNWIYASNFGQDGNIRSVRNPTAEALSTKGGDFRFRLDRGVFEVETGPTQFGQAIDDWGHRFLTENSIHIQQAVFPWRYVHRHPYLPRFRALTNVSDHKELMFQITEPPYWRVERTRRRNEAFKENNLDRVEYADDHFTAASGTTIYTGDAFPDEYYGNIFIGDVSGNLVHRDVISAMTDSVMLIAQRDGNEESREFLTSTDPWFRPVNFTVGPDGVLYVIDMYRQHIEAPPFIPEDLRAGMDFLNGDHMGRIYRIVPNNWQSDKSSTPDLRNMKSHDLVGLLTHPGRWWRLQAQRILLERQDRSIMPALISLFSQHNDARVRLHALFTLEGLNALDYTLVAKAMEDAHPGVRESAMVLSEKFQACLPLLLNAVDDSSARVALAATLSLGEFNDTRVLSAFAKVVKKRGQDPCFRTAVLSSEPGSSLALLGYLISQKIYSHEFKSSVSAFLRDFGYVVGSRNRDGELARFLNTLLKARTNQSGDLELSAVHGLMEGLKSSNNIVNADPELIAILGRMEKDSIPGVSEAIQEIVRLLRGAV